MGDTSHSSEVFKRDWLVTCFPAQLNLLCLEKLCSKRNSHKLRCIMGNERGQLSLILQKVLWFSPGLINYFENLPDCGNFVSIMLNVTLNISLIVGKELPDCKMKTFICGYFRDPWSDIISKLSRNGLQAQRFFFSFLFFLTLLQQK